MPGFVIGLCGLVHRSLAHLFDIAAFLFRVDPFAFRRQGRAGFDAKFFAFGGFAQQCQKPFYRILLVAFLGAVTLRVKNDFAVIGQLAACQFAQSITHALRQFRQVIDAHAHLYRGRYFIDVLAARSGCAHELELQVAFIKIKII